MRNRPKIITPWHALIIATSLCIATNSVSASESQADVAMVLSQKHLNQFLADGYNIKSGSSTEQHHYLVFLQKQNKISICALVDGPYPDTLRSDCFETPSAGEGKTKDTSGYTPGQKRELDMMFHNGQ